MSRPRLTLNAARALAILILLSLGFPPVASAQEDLSAAQQRANQAAEELSRAEEEKALAEDAVAHMETRVAGIEARVSRTRDQVRQLAIRLYMEGPSRLTRMLRMADANQMVRVQQYTRVMAGSSNDALQQYRADREDLERELTLLEGKQESRAEALEDLRLRRAEAIEELDRLARAEAERQRARAAEDARQRAQAPAPGPAASQTTSGPLITSPLRPAQELAGLPAPSADPDPPPPPPPPPPVESSADWVCPVQGPHAFSDDYGAPRGGGFSHQGNDILAPRGTPVVANVDGVVVQRRNTLGGLSYFLNGDDGDSYYGAHLDSYGASGRVTAGTVIGTVGTTGDAAGGPPHLHFEIHPGGSGNINPYPTLSRYC
ncbi:MAG: murein hydrolase activator EnvC [Acidimicrobiales bacterium]